MLIGYARVSTADQQPQLQLDADRVHCLRRARDPVPEGVVRRRRLRKPAVGLFLDRVDQVGELDRVLDEENRDIVAHHVPVALHRVELDREAAGVAGEIGRAAVAGDGREAGKRRRRHADLGQHLRRRIVGDAVG